MINKKNILIIAVFTLLFVGCTDTQDEYARTVDENGNVTDLVGDGDGSSSSSVSIKGTITSSSSRSVMGRALSDIGDISQIVAVAMDGGSTNLNKTKEVSVGSDGSFEVGFDSADSDSNTKWVLMMSKEGNTIEDKIAAFVSMSQGDDAMTSFPMSGASGAIDLGGLSLNGSETTSSNSISDNAANFTQEESELLEMAKLDNSEKMIMNKYINTDTQTGVSYSAYVKFWYDANLSKNEFFNVADYDYGGYRIGLGSSHDDRSEFNSVCNGDKKIEFIPPSSIIISDTNVTVSPENPFTDKSFVMDQAGTACGDSNTTFGANIINIGGIGYEMQAIKGTIIPEGYWKFKEDGVTIAAFDLAVGSIYDQDGALNMFLPSLKFEVDNNDKITKILVKWYRYDKETNQYIEVTNGNLIKNFASGLQIVLVDHNGTTGTRIDESINLSSTDSTAIGDTSTAEISQFQNDWYYKGHNVQADLTIGGIVLNVGFSEGVGISIGF